MCWGGTGGDIAPQTVKKPCRQQLSSVWREVERETVTGSTGLPQGEQAHSLANTYCRLAWFTCTCMHVSMHTQGCTEVSVRHCSEGCIWTEDTCETETANRIKVLSDCSQVCVSPRTRHAATPCVNVICPPSYFSPLWVIFQSSEDGIIEKWLLPGLAPPPPHWAPAM